MCSDKSSQWMKNLSLMLCVLVSGRSCALCWRWSSFSTARTLSTGTWSLRTSFWTTRWTSNSPTLALRCKSSQGRSSKVSESSIAIFFGRNLRSVHEGKVYFYVSGFESRFWQPPGVLEGVLGSRYVKMYDFFGHELHIFSVLKHLKAELLSDPGTQSYQNGVCGVICASIGVIDVKKCENNWSRWYKREANSSFCLKNTGVDVQLNTNTAELLPQHIQQRIFRCPALRLLCLWPSVTVTAAAGGSAGRSGSGCTTCLHLLAALSKVKIQQETQIYTLQSQTLTFQIYLSESIRSPAVGPAKSNVWWDSSSPYDLV